MALPRLRGAFALDFLFAGEDDLVIGARRGSPLAIAMATARCISARTRFAPFTSRIAYLEDGDCVVLRRSGAAVRDAGGSAATRRAMRSNAAAFLLDKGNHRHFTLRP